MTPKWYYAKKGTQYGPVSAQGLRELAARGELDPSDQVWKEGTAIWRPASVLKDLFPATGNPTWFTGLKEKVKAARNQARMLNSDQIKAWRSEADEYLFTSELESGFLSSFSHAVDRAYSIFKPWFGPRWWEKHVIRSYMISIPFSFLWTISHPRSTWVVGKLKDVYSPPWTTVRLLLGIALLPVLGCGLCFLLFFALMTIFGPPVQALSIPVLLTLAIWNQVKWLNNLGAKESDKW